MINISHENCNTFISSYQNILKCKLSEPQFIKAVFLYSAALYMADLLDPSIYKNILFHYQRELINHNIIHLQPRFIPHLLNYIAGKYHENHVRSFKSILVKQYRNLVPAFEYHVDQDSIYTQLIKLVRQETRQLFHSLIWAYYEESITLAELSLLCGSIHSEMSELHPHFYNASLILPLYYFDTSRSLEPRQSLFKYIREYVLQFEGISIDYDIDLSYHTCPHKGLRWVSDVMADLTPHAPPFILREMVSHLKEGYLFGRPQKNLSEGYVGLYIKKR